MKLEIKKKVFTLELVKWHAINKRTFPWRYTKNLYKILIAEVLLQKTNAAKVPPVYTELIKKYPAPSNLKNANLRDLKKIISPLGLKYRAKNLKEAAREIENLNIDQMNIQNLKKIKGIGNYSARSILIHTKDEKYSLIDPNFERIYRRVFNLYSTENRPRNDISLWEKAEMLLPASNISNYVYAMLDFGAIVCTKNKPKCKTCPMFNKICKGCVEQ